MVITCWWKKNEHGSRRRNCDRPGEWLRLTLKRIYVQGDKVRLEPSNAKMEPIIVAAENVLVQGRVIGVLRKYCYNRKCEASGGRSPKHTKAHANSRSSRTKRGRSRALREPKIFNQPCRFLSSAFSMTSRET